MTTLRKIFWVSLFGVAFGLVEASVVVYLRAIYYPEGFTWPLKVISSDHLNVELLREAATIIMLAAVGIVAGKKGWQCFGYFVVAFGVWDVFYYVWLKVFLNWPATLSDWDVLFLIPFPWIGPVIAPCIMSAIMIICGSIIIVRVDQGRYFRPGRASWAVASIATATILYTFMSDTRATLGGEVPLPYNYAAFTVGCVLYLVSFVLACYSRLNADSGDVSS